MATAQCLPSAADIQSTFEHYFSIGFGIADSLRLYRINLYFDNHSGDNGFVFPNYRTVRHWHSLWHNKHGDVQGLTAQSKKSSSNKIKERTEMTSKIAKVPSSVKELGQGEMCIELEDYIPEKLTYKHCSVKMSEFLNSSILPKSFTNKIIHVDDKNFMVHIRSDVNCAQDCFSWVKEFGKRSLTKWILCTRTRNPLREIVCRRVFICQHSSYGEKQPHKRPNKNFNCTATINIVVENAANDSKFAQEGLPALIVIQNGHSHAITTTAAPTSDIQKKFEQYFSKGFGIASSLLYHEENLKGASCCLNVPKYLVVKQWYKKWCSSHPLPNIEDTSVADDELSECGRFKDPNLKMSQYLDVNFLPKSFKSYILKVDDVQFLAYIRSDVNCVKDCMYWIKEFGKQSSTQWILFSTSPNPPPPDIICQRSFVCCHSNYKRKKDAIQKSSKREPNKNFNCKAKITFIVQNPMEEDSFSKKGLPALIVLRNNHNHPIMMAAASPPEAGTQVKFESYFRKGFGISGSIRYHKACLEDKICYFKIPKYDTVKMWHTKWRKKCFGSDLCNNTSEMSESISSFCETMVKLKPSETTKTNIPTMVKISTDKIEDRDFHQLLEEFKQCHQIFGTNRVIHHQLLKRLKAITTKDAWDMFLCTAFTQDSNTERKNMSCK